MFQAPYCGGDRTDGSRRLRPWSGRRLARSTEIELVAVADEDPKGLAAAAKRLGLE